MNQMLPGPGAGAASGGPSIEQMEMAAMAQADAHEMAMSEKRYLWTARAFAIVCAVSVCANLALLLAVIQIQPMTRIEPFFLDFANRSDQVVTIRKMNMSSEDWEALIRRNLREYVILRHSMQPDTELMNRRWGPDGKIRWMSSSQVYAEFAERAKAYFNQDPDNKFRRLTRTVNITSVNQGDQFWQVLFEIVDEIDGATEVNNLVARMQIGWETQKVKYSDRLKNPLGFKITAYEVGKN